MKHIIIGGVAGGATAAARIRRVDEFAEIILLEKGEYISYANCGLPYYIGGTIEDRDNLFVQTPETFSQQFNIDVRVKNEALSIDTKAKTVKIRRADGTTYDESYDRLLLSPGASAVRPPLPGIDSEGIFTLRNVADTDRIKNYITTHDIKKAVVVGAGFIGLEMAENLQHAGAHVSIVEMGNQVMAPVDFSIASHVHQHLIQKGVSLYLEQGVEHFEREADGVQVFFKNGESIMADVVILSIGVRPETKLAREAGIKIGETGGIWVDKYLQTSEKDVYAVGDAIEYPHPLTGKPYLNFLANPANRQGRLVADNMAKGNVNAYEGAIATSIAKVYDLTVASTGLAAKRLKMMDIPYISYTTHGYSHAGYYPDALPLTIKITFSPKEGRLLGAQVVGFEGVDKRIDQLALVIKNGGTVYDLMKIEHAYAPPFSAAKDPVAIIGYAASNILSDVMPICHWRDIANVDLNKTVLLDVRTTHEYSFSTIKGAINIPFAELRDRINELPKDKDIIVFCTVGLRGYLSLLMLKAHGFKNVKNLSGGYRTYSTATAPIVLNKPEDSEPKKVEAVEINTAKKEDVKTVHINACGLQCPGPVLKVKKAIDEISVGERIEIVATDTGFARDAQAWCRSTGNQFVTSSEDKGKYTVVIEKGEKEACPVVKSDGNKGKTLIMFSDDLDKALATFVLANGAAATGQKTTIFFTFWGLNVIKKAQKPKVKKDFFGRMFSWMMPSHSKKLHLSKMSMLGMGDGMMRHIMKKKGIESLENLRQQAIDAGVEFIACQMSMDVMGVKREELLDNVTVGGVATYMERAENANVNLFV